MSPKEIEREHGITAQVITTTASGKRCVGIAMIQFVRIHAKQTMTQTSRSGGTSSIKAASCPRPLLVA
ncbi:MAG TPA: hypothetical protein VK208_13125 [Pyrinomonadaceae bacterium]|nr:hypothetical protein [Pyrinomonadaceae bacterium]